MRTLFDEQALSTPHSLEAAAQAALLERHNIDITRAVPLSSIPVQELRHQWSAFARDAKVQVALQQGYQLLYALKDPIGLRFYDEGLHRIDSPLNSRNSSILGHGYTVLNNHDSITNIWDKALYLLELDEADLHTFPNLHTLISGV